MPALPANRCPYARRLHPLCPYRPPRGPRFRFLWHWRRRHRCSRPDAPLWSSIPRRRRHLIGSHYSHNLCRNAHQLEIEHGRLANRWRLRHHRHHRRHSGCFSRTKNPRNLCPPSLRRISSLRSLATLDKVAPLPWVGLNPLPLIPLAVLPCFFNITLCRLL
jgi:hypothetical protein